MWKRVKKFAVQKAKWKEKCILESWKPWKSIKVRGKNDVLLKKFLGILGSKKLWKPCPFRLFSVHFEMWKKSKRWKKSCSAKNAYAMQIIIIKSYKHLQCKKREQMKTICSVKKSILENKWGFWRHRSSIKFRRRKRKILLAPLSG